MPAPMMPVPNGKGAHETRDGSVVVLQGAVVVEEEEVVVLEGVVVVDDEGSLIPSADASGLE